jgi:predicted nucleic acid-binding Zn ribbon protein
MKECKQCKKPFDSKIKNQVHCSEKCRNKQSTAVARERRLSAKIDLNFFDWRMYKEGVI